MMKLFPLVAVLILVACSGKTAYKLPGKIKKLSWLEGRWESKSEEGMLSETWAKLDDSTYTGESYFEISGDTVFTEKIRLEEHMNGVFYIPTVSGQNGGKPVTFKMQSAGKSTAVFENKQHDFPQKIVYTLVDDSIKVTISGMENGASKMENFVMRRSD